MTKPTASSRAAASNEHSHLVSDLHSQPRAEVARAAPEQERQDASTSAEHRAWLARHNEVLSAIDLLPYRIGLAAGRASMLREPSMRSARPEVLRA